LPREATASARHPDENHVARLARFFPAAVPVRLPIRLSPMGVADTRLENTIIEFSTTREVLFACTQPLEFGAQIRLQNSDGSLDVEASVVALQYNDGQTAVAARFSKEVPNWIVKP